MSDRKRTFAVINDRGRNHKVSAGDRVLVDLMEGAAPGAEVVFDQVVLLAKAGGATTVGKPNVEGAKVVAVIEREHKGEKLKIYKWRRRENYRRRIGHRQRYTQVRIRQISA